MSTSSIRLVSSADGGGRYDNSKSCPGGGTGASSGHHEASAGLSYPVERLHEYERSRSRAGLLSSVPDERSARIHAAMLPGRDPQAKRRRETCSPSSRGNGGPECHRSESCF